MPVRYDAETKLLANFQQDQATHISNHIQEWRKRKRLIKADIPQEFLLEWFLKSSQPYISKDVSLFGVFTEEKAIFRAQHLELIYSQFGVLQKILPDTPRSKVDISKPKPDPHADGLVGSIDVITVNLLNQLQQLSLQDASSTQTSSSVSTPSQPMSIKTIQTYNPKGNQQPDRKRKGRGKKKNQEGKGNANKLDNDAGEGRKESKKKVKFPCKLCNGDHLTHLRPKIQDTQCLLAQ